MKLFVYGSLKRGFFNHDRFGFSGAAEFLGEGTASGVALTQLRGMPYPHAFKYPDSVVKGELYELNNKQIADALDRMERGAGYVPHDVEVNGELATMYVANDEVAAHSIFKDGKPSGKVLEEWTLDRQAW